MLSLPFRPPYDWDALLGFLALRAIPGVEAVQDGVYARAIAIGDARGALMVRRADNVRLSVTVRFPHLPALPTIIARVRRVFDLAADPVIIGDHLSQDPALEPLVAARPGLRVPGAWDGFELGIRAILGQQISVNAAVALAATLTARHGEPLAKAVPGWPGLTHIFPTAQALAAADLSGLPMPRARSAALAGLARTAVGDPDLFGLRGDLDEAVARLRGLPGVGEWTAQYIAMRQLREPDAFPAADIGLMRAMADAEGRRPGAATLQARAERWRPWRAYAAMHLWASETPPDKPGPRSPAPHSPRQDLSRADSNAA
jgi:AraC family transcriptional regulator of adaptative response / DNA-3-methyladenine glycosylase II